MASTVTTAINDNVCGFLSRTHQLLIDANWVDAASVRTFPIYDPATGERLAEVAHREAEDVARAVAAARRAFEECP